MGYIQTAKVVTGTKSLWGRNWYYDFRALDIGWDDDRIEKTVAKLSKTFAERVKMWEKEECSEWTCRTFMSAKLIMNATANLEVSDLFESDGITLMAPTLRYYALLALCRGICLVDPSQLWSDGDLIRIGHQAAIDNAVAFIDRFDQQASAHVAHAAKLFKASREVISYRAPTSGVEIVDEAARLGVEDLCVAMAELIQLATEIMDRAVDRYLDPKHFGIKQSHIDQVSKTVIGSKTFTDYMDRQRLDYLRRKHPRPTNAMMILTEGHVDDFSVAWEEQYADGKIDWRRLFDVA